MKPERLSEHAVRKLACGAVPNLLFGASMIVMSLSFIEDARSSGCGSRGCVRRAQNVAGEGHAADMRMVAMKVCWEAACVLNAQVVEHCTDLEKDEPC